MYRRKRASKKVPILFLLAIVGAGAFFFLTDDSAIAAQRDKIPQIVEEFDNGDTIAFNKPITAPTINQEPKAITKQDEIMNEQLQTNGTSSVGNVTQIEDSSVGITSLSYSNTFEAIESAERMSGMPVTVIGQILKLSGVVQLHDNKGDVVIPREYRYKIDVTCDFRDYCSLTTITNRGMTNIDGSFEYKLTTNPSDYTDGTYKAIMTLESEATDESGNKYKRTSTYDFMLIMPPEIVE